MADHSDGIARITLDGSERNLLNPGLMARVEHELREADADASVTGILITGAGDMFCGGLDIAAIRAGADPVEFASALVSLLKVFPRLTKPIAARVNGDALASGASIVAVCDYAVAPSSARLGTLEVSLGIWPMVAQVPLIQRLGARLAMENIGSGEPFTAERASEVGLINLVRDGADLDVAVMTWLAAAARGGAAVAAGRPLLYELAELPFDDSLNLALSKFSAMFSSGGAQ